MRLVAQQFLGRWWVRAFITRPPGQASHPIQWGGPFSSKEAANAYIEGWEDGRQTEANSEESA